jgi:hypothetical protein
MFNSLVRGHHAAPFSSGRTGQWKGLALRLFSVAKPTNQQTAAPRPPASPDLSPVTEVSESSYYRFWGFRVLVTCGICGACMSCVVLVLRGAYRYCDEIPRAGVPSVGVPCHLPSTACPSSTTGHLQRGQWAPPFRLPRRPSPDPIP